MNTVNGNGAVPHNNNNNNNDNNQYGWLINPQTKDSFNMGEFERLVSEFYTGGNPRAHHLLAQFEANPNAYRHVAAIVQNARVMNSKMIALSVLHKTIRTQWLALPQQEKIGIRQFSQGLLKTLASDPNIEKMGPFVTKLNSVLIEVVKREWPHNWPNFISEVCNDARSSPQLCINHMKLLALLCQDASENVGDLTHARQDNLKANLNKEFNKVFDLCIFAFDKGKANDRLITETLTTFVSFLRLQWLPTRVIMESNVIERLSMEFFGNHKFRNTTLECLTEIVGIKGVEQNMNYIQKIVCLFIKTLETTFTTHGLTPKVDVKAFVTSNAANRTFASYFCNFLVAMLKNHQISLEKHSDASRETLKAALHFIGAFTDMEDSVLFSICVEYWELLARKLKQRFGSRRNSLLGGTNNSNNNNSNGSIEDAVYINIYKGTLHTLKYVLMRRLPRPKEVLVMEDDFGNIVKHEMKDTLGLSLHKQISDTLRLLSALDPQDTRKVIGDNLNKFDKNQHQISFQQLESLCWSIGAVAGSMSADVEKSFLVVVIKILLSLCEVQKTKNAKAIIASCIMYVVRKYPRFLKKHWKFLQTVVRKLIEFLHEKHPGVQDMSIETLEEICDKCGDKFLQIQENDTGIFLDELIEQMHGEMCKDLNEEQVQNLYHVWGKVIGKERNRESNHGMSGADAHGMQYPQLIERLLKAPNNGWKDLVSKAAVNANILTDEKSVKQIIHILRTYRAVARAVTQKFLLQMQKIFADLINVYKFYAGKTKDILAQAGNNPNNVNTMQLKAYGSVKSEILQLFEQFASSASRADHALLLEQFIPRFLGILLEDYQGSPNNIKIAACLGTCAALIETVGSGMNTYVKPIFQAALAPTAEMIRQNLTDWPDHRKNCFRLTRAICDKCLDELKQLDANSFKFFIDAMMFGMDHYDARICEQSLCALESIVDQLEERKDDATGFYKNQLGTILPRLMNALTDTLHKSFVENISLLFLKIFSQVLDANKCGVLSSENNVNGVQMNPNEHNMEWVGKSFVKCVMAQHAGWDEQTVVAFIKGLMQNGKELRGVTNEMYGNANDSQRKNVMAKNENLCEDFLVQLKQIKLQNAHLQQAQQAQQARQVQQAQQSQPQQQQQQQNGQQAPQVQQNGMNGH